MQDEQHLKNMIRRIWQAIVLSVGENVAQKGADDGQATAVSRTSSHNLACELAAAMADGVISEEEQQQIFKGRHLDSNSKNLALKLAAAMADGVISEEEQKHIEVLSLYLLY
jgi:uncharacterized membrane protein YebE (DUF533 family)